jgi:hypothetical protein
MVAECHLMLHITERRRIASREAQSSVPRTLHFFDTQLHLRLAFEFSIQTACDVGRPCSLLGILLFLFARHFFSFFLPGGDPGPSGSSTSISTTFLSYFFLKKNAL